MFLKATGILLAIFCIKAFSSEKIVYGEDNRLDYYQVNTFYQSLADSTAAMIPNSSLHKTENSILILGNTLLERGVCPNERFINQHSAAHCSGFLVGDDLLVTAGHCINSKEDCLKNSWVFNFRLNSSSSLPKSTSSQYIYNCKEIIESEFSNKSLNDYALIKLDRKVEGKTPLRYRRQGQIKKGTPLVVIGHPTGLPTKIADNAQVTNISRYYFSANLDTFSGNSGSAVFDANTGVVEGILVRGGLDYIIDECDSVNRVGNFQGKGEEITYISNIKYLK